VNALKIAGCLAFVIALHLSLNWLRSKNGRQ